MGGPRGAKPSREGGFITLASVVVLIAIGFAVVLGMMVYVASITDTELIRRDGLQAAWLADACAERARSQLRSGASYSGDETLTLTGGTCEVMPIDTLSSGSYEVHALGNAGEAFSRVLVTFEVSGGASGSQVTQTSWSRVADF